MKDKVTSTYLGVKISAELEEIAKDFILRPFRLSNTRMRSFRKKKMLIFVLIDYKTLNDSEKLNSKIGSS